MVNLGSFETISGRINRSRRERKRKSEQRRQQRILQERLRQSGKKGSVQLIGGKPVIITVEQPTLFTAEGEKAKPDKKGVIRGFSRLDLVRIKSRSIKKREEPKKELKVFAGPTLARLEKLKPKEQVRFIGRIDKAPKRDILGKAERKLTSITQKTKSPLKRIVAGTVGQFAVGVGKGVQSFGRAITSPIKTGKEVIAFGKELIKRPKQTTKAIVKEFELNPAGFIGELAGFQGAFSTTTKIAKTVISPNVVRGVFTTKLGKARLSPSSKKSARIIRKLKKTKTKAEIKKGVRRQKVELQTQIAKQKDEIRAFKITQKDGFITGVELGKGKKGTRTTFRTPKKAKQVITKIIEKDVHLGKGQVAKKLLKVKQVQKFERKSTSSLKALTRLEQKTKQVFNVRTKQKGKLLKQIIDISKPEQARGLQLTKNNLPRGIRDPRVIDRLNKLKQKVLKEQQTKTRLFVKSLNSLIKKNIVARKLVASQKNAKKIVEIAQKNKKVFKNVSKKAKEVSESSSKVKDLEDLSKTVARLVAIIPDTSFVGKPITVVKSKALDKTKPTPSTKPQSKISFISEQEIKVSTPSPTKVISKTRKKSVAKTIKKPSKKGKFLPKTITKIKKPIIKPKFLVKRKSVPKIKKILKIKLPKKSFVKKKTKKVKPLQKDQVIFFTPTLIRPSKKSKDDEVLFDKKKLKLFTGAELR